MELSSLPSRRVCNPSRSGMKFSLRRFINIAPLHMKRQANPHSKLCMARLLGYIIFRLYHLKWRVIHRKWHLLDPHRLYPEISTRSDRMASSSKPFKDGAFIWRSIWDCGNAHSTRCDHWGWRQQDKGQHHSFETILEQTRKQFFWYPFGFFLLTFILCLFILVITFYDYYVFFPIHLFFY